jgi:hypothetical protein
MVFDLLMVALTVLFFALAAAYIAGCEHLE